MSNITETGHQIAQRASNVLTYGGATFSVFQWLADNANWIAAFVGIFVTVVGFVWNRIDLHYKNKAEAKARELEEFLLLKEEERRQEEHDAKMTAIKYGLPFNEN